MAPADFRPQIASLTAQLAGRPLDTWLNAEHGPRSATYATIEAACRVVKPAPDVHDCDGPTPPTRTARSTW